MSRWDEVEAKDTIAGNGCYVKLSPIVVIPAKAGISAPVQIPHGFAAIYIPAKLGAGMTHWGLRRLDLLQGQVKLLLGGFGGADGFFLLFDHLFGGFGEETGV